MLMIFSNVNDIEVKFCNNKKIIIKKIKNKKPLILLFSVTLLAVSPTLSDIPSLLLSLSCHSSQSHKNKSFLCGKTIEAIGQVVATLSARNGSSGTVGVGGGSYSSINFWSLQQLRKWVLLLSSDKT